jgi:hypothetical protein
MYSVDGGGSRRRMCVIVFLYRWKIVAGKEKSFEDAWSILTKKLLEKGSLGSRLHLGSDGLFYGYAQWPSREARENVRFDSEMERARSIMKNATIETLTEIVLDPVADFLVPNKINLSP